MSSGDWTMLAIVAAGALLGLWRGFVGGVLDLVAIGAAGAACLWFLSWLDSTLDRIGIANRGTVLAAVTVEFVVVYGIGTLLARLIEGPLGLPRMVPPLGLLDHLLGVVPGIAKGGAVAMLVALVVAIQFPATALGGTFRASPLARDAVRAGSATIEDVAERFGRRLDPLTAFDIAPGRELAGTATAVATPATAQPGLAAQVLALVNTARREWGSRNLSASDALDQIAAEQAATAMPALRGGRLPVTAPDVSARLAREGRSVLALGAVLGAGRTPAEAVTAMLACADHRDVLLSDTYLRCGIAVVAGADGEILVVGVFTF